MKKTRINPYKALRRAEVTSFLLSAILAILLLFLSLLFTNNIVHKYDDYQKLDLCRKSTLLYSASQPTAVEMISGYEGNIKSSGKGLECPVIYKTVEEYKPIKDDEYVKKIVADQMAGCWYKFNEGDVNLFARQKGEMLHYCAVCSVISFKGDAKGKQIPHFIDYLAENQIPALFGRMNYTQYLYGVATDDEMLQELGAAQEFQQLSTIDTSRDYVVMFFYPKKGYGTSVEYAAKGTAIGGGVGYVLDKVITLVPQLKPLKIIAGKRLLIATTAAGGLIGAAVGHDTPFEKGALTLLLPNEPELIQKLQCDMPVPLGYRPE